MVFWRPRLLGPNDAFTERGLGLEFEPTLDPDNRRNDVSVAEVASQTRAATQPLSLPALTLSFLKIGIIGFGGGMAIIALMEHEFVRRRRVIEADEFLHGVGLGQILGPFAVNTALFTGYRLYGVVGGLLSVGAFMAPSLALVLVLSWLYFKFHALPALQGAVGGLGPVVIALILSAAWSMGRKALRSWPAIGLCIIATIAGLSKINSLYVLASAGILGLALGKARLAGVENSQETSETIKPAGEKPRLPSGIFLWFVAPGLKTAATVSMAQLGFTFFTVGLIFFGGGFVLVPVLHQTLVVKLAWLTSQEFVDGVAISNLTPGPISVLATFAGYRLRGLPGALIATGALYLPALVLMTGLSHEYGRLRERREAQAFLSGITPAVIGLILSTAVLLAPATLHSWRGYCFAVVALVLLARWKVHPAILLAVGAAAGTAAVLP
jgi:chromate transporter